MNIKYWNPKARALDILRRMRRREENGIQEKQTTVTKLAHEPRTHLEQYLAYFVAIENPGYAVMVTGEWGTGKTHQVTYALPAAHAHYISLFGLNTPDEIEAYVFAKMFPKRASLKKLADKLSSVTAGMPGYGSIGVNGLTSALANAFIKTEVDNSKPLIFDDLERCSVANRKILGLINRYVEHHKCRVIVIAHDTKIVDAFKDTKEKIFGQTLAVQPNVEAAFEEFNAYFVQQHESDHLGDLTSEILGIFTESKTASLRILRHAVEDTRRLFAALEDRHRQNRAAMMELVRLFSALAIEYRANNLLASDLIKRKAAIASYLVNASSKDKQKEASGIASVNAKYTAIDLSSNLLNDDVLVEMLTEGRFVPTHIRESLNVSPYFIRQDDARPWQIVINFDTLDDNIVAPALQRMADQFPKREISEPGELLHVVALQMMMAKEGVKDETVQQVRDRANDYIDNLLKEGRLAPRRSELSLLDSIGRSHAGIAYWVAEAYKDEFKDVFDHLVQAEKKAFENSVPNLIPSLLDIVRTDGQKFFEKVCYTHGGTMDYQDVPILAHIPPNDFVDAWLASPKTGWYWIGGALKDRIQRNGRTPAWKPETVWVANVASEMRKRAERQSGLARVRIIRAIGRLGSVPSADEGNAIN